MSKLTHMTARARRMARNIADRYFAALAAEIPYDTAPGGVNLIDDVLAIQRVIIKDSTSQHDVGGNLDAALHVGYLLGIEVGRRMSGGAP